MMRIHKRRVLATLVVTAAAAVCGILGGSLLGRYLTLRQAQRDLIANAARSLAKTDARLSEARSVMAALHDSSYAPCSDTELTYFRTLIYNAKFLKDAGRMNDGEIDCSAALARPPLPLAAARQDFTLPGGTKIYKHLAPYKDEDLAVITLQNDGIYIVLIPYIQPNLGPGPERISETVREAQSGRHTWLLGDQPLTGAVLGQDGFARAGDNLYATRCSKSFLNCVTASVSIPDAMRVAHSQMRIYTVLGGVTGGLLGFFCSLLYRRSRNMEQQLRRALRNDRLRVVYQPIVSLTGGRIVGAEALARWTDEDGFVVGPDTFIKVAEERGFVQEITKLVVRHVLRDFKQELRTRSPFRVNVNVTAADLADPQFPALLERSLEDAKVPASSLGIEITESSTACREIAMNTILRLRKNGHCVYVDDFGTGYSSLAYLHALSVDSIKIDRSFTQAIGTEAVTVAILPQILAMAKALHLQVVVEGVETGEQADYFAGSERPIHAQGWFYGRPVSAEEFRRLLEADDTKALDEMLVEAERMAQTANQAEKQEIATPPTDPALQNFLTSFRKLFAP